MSRIKKQQKKNFQKERSNLRWRKIDVD